MTFQVASKPINGPARAGTVVNVAPKVRLVFYPGETVTGGRTMGNIYVFGGANEKFEACGGPKSSGADGPLHSFGPTPKGKYILGPQHQHVTKNWPNSCLPWGARIRLTGSIFEYKDKKGVWHEASGPNGYVTKINIAYMVRQKERALTPVEKSKIEGQVYKLFFDDRGAPITKWIHNDFGNWAWNLTKGGSGTAYYIHTTPPDEIAWDDGNDIPLENSHGCVHIHPSDRNEMVLKGYLKKGVVFEVRGYDQKGPW
jgi:hypothetical protein